MALTGDKVTGLDTTWDTQDTSGTTTSTTYTATLTGGTACGVAFVAPFSGKVLIHNSIYCFNGAPLSNFSFGSFRIRTGGTVGSGTDVLTAADTRAVVTNYVNSQTRTQAVSGLTAGATYNVQQLFRVDGNTGTFLGKQLIVEPQP